MLDCPLLKNTLHKMNLAVTVTEFCKKMKRCDVQTYSHNSESVKCFLQPNMILIRSMMKMNWDTVLYGLVQCPMSTG